MKLKSAVFMIVLLGLVACGKNTGTIPSVGVNFQSSVTDPRISAINAVGGVALVSGYGVAGLIIYHEPDGSYAAYDRCSSYNPQNRCAVTLDDSHLTVTDPCSGSKFYLEDGTPAKGPATRSLKTYNAYVSNFQIFVTN